jgi:iron(III) transport system substrate-binding protein
MWTQFKAAMIAKSMLAASLTVSTSAQAKQLNIVCSVQAEWCQLIANGYAKTTNVKINVTHKGSVEALGQIVAEGANPKTDVWFGGTGDPHLQAAEQNLTAEYKSALIPQLRDWAQAQAKQSNYKTIGIYASAIGFGYNTEVLAKKKLKAPTCWADLLKPEFKGEVQMANPASSGTAYVAIATLVQIMGEDKAFDYLKAIHKNVSSYPRSGTGPIKAVARGEAGVSVSFVHDAPVEALQGFPVKAVTPCEGTGYEIGSMSIMKGARNMEEAKKFYDWALTAAAQEMGAAAKQFQLPSNSTAKVDPRGPDFKQIKLIKYDFAKYGSSAERKRLTEKWQKDVGTLPQ